MELAENIRMPEVTDTLHCIRR